MGWRHDRSDPDLRTAYRERPDAAFGYDLLLSVLHNVFWHDAGCGDSESGGSHTSRATRRVPHLVSVIGLYLSGGKHSPAAALAVLHCADALLPGSDSRCIFAWRRLAGAVARSVGPGPFGRLLFSARLARHERHAG